MYTANYKDAEKDFKSAIKEDEKNIWAYIWLSEVYAYGDKDQKKATDYLTSLLDKFPNDVRIFRERANINKYYNNLAMANTDYEMAYNLLLDDPSQTDQATAAEIVRWHAELYMRSKKIVLADESVVKILEDGLKTAPDDAKLLGELALAYNDVGKTDKAYEYGRKANAISKSTVGSLFVALDAFKKQDYFNAATLMWEADRSQMQMHSHPLVYYYFALIQWDYCTKVAPNQWVNNKGIIKNRLELAVQFGEGTRYTNEINHAKEMLKVINQ
jgi:Tfp pilus assembly protein PilF